MTLKQKALFSDSYHFLFNLFMSNNIQVCYILLNSKYIKIGLNAIETSHDIFLNELEVRPVKWKLLVQIFLFFYVDI